MLWVWLASSGSGSARALLLLILWSALVVLLSNGLGVLLVLVHGPVKDVVVLEPFAHKEIAEDLAEIRIVWLVVEAEGASVVQVDGELIWESTAEDLGWGGHLLLHNAVVLLLLGSSLKSLPWEGATTEVEHDVSEGLHVVTTRLLCIKLVLRTS